MTSNITSTGFVGTPNSQLFFEQEGNKSGPPILFIHGLGGTTNTYQSLVPSLQEFNLIRFDFSGHGRSTVPPATTIQTYVEDCEAVIRHFGIKEVTVVGHSLGGLIALHLAAKNPSLISRLILFGPVKAPAQAGRDGCRARAEIVRLGGMVACTDSVINNALAATTKTSRPEVVGFARELLTRQDAEGYALACLALGAAENPVWADIAADVTVVSGGQDKVSNPETCKSIVDSIKKGNLVTWEECGHWHTLESALDSADIVKRSML